LINVIPLFPSKIGNKGTTLLRQFYHIKLGLVKDFLLGVFPYVVFLLFSIFFVAWAFFDVQLLYRNKE